MEKENKLCETILELFNSAVEKFPDTIALVFGDEVMSYEELNYQSSYFAGALCRLGVQPKEGIAILLPRGMDQIISILAILKCGCYYIPIDINIPEARVLNIINNSLTTLIVTDNSQQNKIPDGLNFITISNKEYQKKITHDKSKFQKHVSSDDIAYVIYTSGTTGNPKGVKVNHRSVVSLFTLSSDYFNFNNVDVIPLFHSYAFDFSVWEIWSALFNGGKLLLLPYEVCLSPEAVCLYLSKYNVTVLNQTPTAFKNLLLAVSKDNLVFTQLRLIVLGGEKLDYSKLSFWFEIDQSSFSKLINMYGITEGTIHVTYHEVSRNECYLGAPSIIGKPLPHIYCYVLNEYMKKCVDGEYGTLYLGGEGVSCGYLNEPVETKKRFINDPFTVNSYIYDTGDRVRYINDVLEYLGRNDHQVKIRGYRIEKDDIKTNILKFQGIDDVYLQVSKRHNGDDYLIAYLIINKNFNKLNGFWSPVFEALYDNSKKNAPNSMYVGWNDSRDNTPIPIEQMDIWKEMTVNSLLDFDTSTILEIGFGSGLIVSSLLHRAQSYFATEISTSAISLVEESLRENPHFDKLVIFNQDASNFDNIPQNNFSLIIMNSVAQYFEDSQYFINVLDNLVASAKNTGTLFVGDLRNINLAKFQYSARHNDARKILSQHDFSMLIDFELGCEKELLISPAFFMNFCNENPRVRGVQLRLKRGNYINELSKYRFDVVLFIGEVTKELISTKEMLKLDNNIHIKDSILSLRRDGCDRPVYIEALNNINLQVDVMNTDNITLDQNFVSYEDLCTQLESEGEAVLPLVNLESPWKFDIVSFPKGSDTHFTMPFHDYNSKVIEKTFNAPFLYSKINTHIKNLLKDSLPDYMIPSTMYNLPFFPVTINGKINDELLKVYIETKNKTNFKENESSQSNENLEALISVCKEVLSIEEVNESDNYFSIGGDSITSISLINKLKKRGLGLTLRDIFGTKNILELSNKITIKISDKNDSEIAPNALPLLAIHYWFNEQNLLFPFYWNQGSVFSLPSEIDTSLLKKSIEDVLDNIDILKYQYDNLSLLKSTLPLFSGEIIFENNLKNMDIITYFNTLLSEKFDKANICYFCIFINNETGEKKLFISINHVYVDTISWWQFFSSVEEAYRNLGKSKNHYRINNYIKWSSYAIKKASSLEYFDYWKSIVDNYKTPFDSVCFNVKSKNIYNDSIKNIVNIPFSKFNVLMQKTNLKLDLIVYAFIILNIYKWLDIKEFSVNFEHNGRDPRCDIDWSGLFGWFTAIYPCNFSLSSDDFYLNFVEIVKILSNIPSNGIDYSLYRYINPNKSIRELLAYDIYSGININFNGKLIETENIFSRSENIPIRLRAGENIRPAILEINSWVASDYLCIELEWNKEYFNEENIKKLFDGFSVNAENLMISSVSLPIENKFNEVYGRSPLMSQLHAIYSDNLREYIPGAFNVMKWSIRGELFLEKYISAWRDTINNFDCFSLGIVVGPKKEIGYIKSNNCNDVVVYFDSNENYTDNILDCVENGDSFVIKKLASVVIIRCDDSLHQVIFHYHQLLLDGWSLSNIFMYLSEKYDAILSEPNEKMNGKFSEYLKETPVVENKPLNIHDVSQLATMFRCNDIYVPYDVFTNPGVNFLKIDSYAYTKIKNIAFKNKITLNTLCLYIFLVALSKFEVSASVSLGVLFSGRPSSHPELQSAVGVFTRVSLLNFCLDHETKTTDSLVAALQDKIVSLQEVPSIDATFFSNVSSEVFTFKYVYIFQNYPNITSFENFSSFKIEDFVSKEVTTYPVSLRVLPIHDQLIFKFSFITEIISHNAMESLIDILKNEVENLCNELG